MENLSCFLKQNKIKKENVRFVASEGFVDKQKKPIIWEIKVLTNEEMESMRKECMRKKPLRNGTYSIEINEEELIGKILAKSTVYPELTNAELQNSYGVMSDDALLKRMLDVGEYTKYQNKVLELNGLNNSLEDKIEEAKN